MAKTHQLDPETVGRYLKSGQCPPGISREDLDQSILEMVQLALRLTVMGQAGALPAPPTRSRSLIRRLLQFLERPGRGRGSAPARQWRGRRGYEDVSFASEFKDRFHSCFISYSTVDQEFAERIHADLQKNGIRCWFAPEDLKIGDRFFDRISESIHAHDKRGRPGRS